MQQLHDAAKLIKQVASGTPVDEAWLREAEEWLSRYKGSKATYEQVCKAAAVCGDENVEVNVDAVTSVGDAGVWVSAWVFIGQPLKGKVYERGNGFPNVGELIRATLKDGTTVVLRLDGYHSGTIHVGQPGTGNYLYAEFSLVDDDALVDDSSLFDAGVILDE